MPEDPKLESSLVALQERMRATLAKNILLARRAKYLNQGELAEKAGHSRATLAQIENGKADPALSTIVDLCNALNLSPFLLLLGEADFKLLVEMSEEMRIHPGT